MNKTRGYYLGLGMFVIGIALIAVSFAHMAPFVRDTATAAFFDRLGFGGRFEQELKTGEYITIIDEKTSRVVDKTSRVVYVGDEFINEENEQYRVVKVRGNNAYAKSLGKAKDIVWKDEWETAPVGAATEPAQGELKKTQIGIYHTHSDESYVPTEGVSSKPAKGGVLKVGSTLASELRKQGIAVIDDKTPHEPHDANAYHRSRKTAVNLLKYRPVALLDVHRDGVPDPDFYSGTVEGEDVTKIRFVVGRQNPKMATNLAFAKQLKAYMDKHKPGLIKGIFIGKGNYNQDLGPGALLLEIGTHTNSREKAENGAAIFAEALPEVLNLQPVDPQGQVPEPGAVDTGNTWSTIGWIVGIVFILGGAFLFISTGSIKGMKSKLGELRKTEFANFFGLKKKNK